MAQANINPITRRSLISGTAAVASTGTAVLLPSLPVLAGTGGDDAKLMQPYDDLRRAWALQNSLDVTLTDEEFETGKLDAAMNACGVIVDQIEQCHATTIEGLRAKALAFLWCHGGDITLKEFTYEQTTDVRLIKSIVHDLLA